jgi:hypothetical protein
MDLIPSVKLGVILSEAKNLFCCNRDIPLPARAAVKAGLSLNMTSHI